MSKPLKENAPPVRSAYAQIVLVLPVIFAIAAGMLIGLGAFTFGYGQGASYFSNNPQSCANCHAMQEHYDTWQQSSHHHVAVCNDCHTPHDTVGKWVTKADNGFFHSIAFTLNDYHDPIQIKSRNSVVTRNACISCHEDVTHDVLPVDDNVHTSAIRDTTVSCVHCHSAVGHAFRPFSSGSERE